MILVNKKITNLIKSFSDVEIKEFKKFISSPVYSNGRNYLPVLNEILKINKNGYEGISSHELYSKLYPLKKYNPQTLKNRFSELFKLGEEYLVYKSLNENNIEKDKILLKKYLDKKLFKLFDGKYKKTRKFIDSLPDNDEKYRNISFLNGINVSLLTQKKNIDKMYRQYNDRIAYSTCLSLIELYEFGIEFVMQEYDNRKLEFNVVAEILKKFQIDGLIKGFRKSNLKIFKVVSMYYYLYNAFKNPVEEKHYFESKKIFNEINNYLSSEYKDSIYKSMINYCIIRQNSGIKKFQYELFNLYNEKLRQGLYSEFKASMYPVNNFRDYVFIGVEIKEYIWVENLLKKYSHELPEEIREDEINITYAKLSFSNRNFERSLSHLNKVKGANYLHYGDCSVLKLCCYYEMERFEDSYFEIDKFKHYLSNHHEIPKVHSTPAINFLKVYRKILSAKTQPGKNDFGFLEKELSAYKSVAKKDWLLEKVIN